MRYVNSSSSLPSSSSHDATGSPIIRSPAPGRQLMYDGDNAAEIPVQMAAIAILMPSGVLRLTAVATTSLRPEEGRLSAGYEDRIPAIPAVIFYHVSSVHLRISDIPDA